MSSMYAFQNKNLYLSSQNPESLVDLNINANATERAAEDASPNGTSGRGSNFAIEQHAQSPVAPPAAIRVPDPFPQVDQKARNWSDFSTLQKKNILRRMWTNVGRATLAAWAKKLVRIIDAAVRDEDEWVRSLGRLLEGLPKSNRVNPAAVDSELVYKINSDFAEIFRKTSTTSSAAQSAFIGGPKFFQLRGTKVVNPTATASTATGGAFPSQQQAPLGPPNRRYLQQLKTAEQEAEEQARLAKEKAAKTAEIRAAFVKEIRKAWGDNAFPKVDESQSNLSAEQNNKLTGGLAAASTSSKVVKGNAGAATHQKTHAGAGITVNERSRAAKSSSSKSKHVQEGGAGPGADRSANAKSEAEQKKPSLFFEPANSKQFQGLSEQERKQKLFETIRNKAGGTGDGESPAGGSPGSAGRGFSGAGRGQKSNQDASSHQRPRSSSKAAHHGERSKEGAEESSEEEMEDSAEQRGLAFFRQGFAALEAGEVKRSPRLQPGPASAKAGNEHVHQQEKHDKQEQDQDSSFRGKNKGPQKTRKGSAESVPTSRTPQSQKTAPAPAPSSQRSYDEVDEVFALLDSGETREDKAPASLVDQNSDAAGGSADLLSNFLASVVGAANEDELQQPGRREASRTGKLLATDQEVVHQMSENRNPPAAPAPPPAVIKYASFRSMRKDWLKQAQSATSADLWANIRTEQEPGFRDWFTHLHQLGTASIADPNFAFPEELELEERAREAETAEQLERTTRRQMNKPLKPGQSYHISSSSRGGQPVISALDEEDEARISDKKRRRTARKEPQEKEKRAKRARHSSAHDEQNADRSKDKKSLQLNEHIDLFDGEDGDEAFVAPAVPTSQKRKREHQQHAVDAEDKQRRKEKEREKRRRRERREQEELRRDLEFMEQNMDFGGAAASRNATRPAPTASSGDFLPPASNRAARRMLRQGQRAQQLQNNEDDSDSDDEPVFNFKRSKGTANHSYDMNLQDRSSLQQATGAVGADRNNSSASSSEVGDPAELERQKARQRRIRRAGIGKLDSDDDEE
ncbi:unnamed protein product [Amoebophrya sp. A120]|nr:unnamed protein product [Amoebophrya sp. A120]|eukprot:GSA120T00018998001.1